MSASLLRRAAAAHDAGAVVDALRRIVRALRVSASEVERGTGISAAQLLVLRTVASAAGASLGDVQRATLTDLSSVSVVVGRLVDRGLLRRGTDSADGRRARLDVTRAGRGMLSRAPRPAQERLLSAIRALPRGEIRALAASLGSLVAALGARNGPGSMFFEDAESRPGEGARRRRS